MTVKYAQSTSTVPTLIVATLSRSRKRKKNEEKTPFHDASSELFLPAL